MEVSQPASAGDRRYPANRVNFHLRLTTIRHSAARFRGAKDYAAINLGFRCAPSALWRKAMSWQS